MADHRDDLNEQAGAFETEETVWQEEHPPADGFEDHEMAHATEVLDGDIPLEEEESAADLESPKKRMWIPAAAAVVGVLFVGAMLYVQFGGQNAPASPPPSAAMGDLFDKTQQKSSSAPTTDAIAALQGAAPGTGNAEQSLESGLASDPLTTASSLTEAPPAPPAEAKAAPQAQAFDSQPLPVPPAPVAELPKAPVAPVETPKPPVASKPVVDLAPIPALASAKTEGEASSLSAPRLESLQKSLETLTTRLDQIDRAVTNLQAAVVQPTTDPVLLERLGKIEKQIAEQGIPVKAKATPKAAAAALPTPAPETEAFVEKPAPREVKEAKHTAVHKAAKKHAEKKAKAAVEKKSKHWTLRAATPEGAWISKGADSEEMQQVSVGQTLKGVGKVKAIRQTAEGNWEVVGTSGSIR